MADEGVAAILEGIKTSMAEPDGSQRWGASEAASRLGRVSCARTLFENRPKHDADSVRYRTEFNVDSLEPLCSYDCIKKAPVCGGQSTPIPFGRAFRVTEAAYLLVSTAARSGAPLFLDQAVRVLQREFPDLVVRNVNVAEIVIEAAAELGVPIAEVQEDASRPGGGRAQGSGDLAG